MSDQRPLVLSVAGLAYSGGEVFVLLSTWLVRSELKAEAVQSLLEGQHMLVVIPTGAGKSPVFQLAALLREGLTLVVSPLISLMKDQVDALAQRGIPATYINSALPAAEQNARLQRLAQGKYRLVYVAPERLRSVPFLTALQGQRVSLLAVVGVCRSLGHRTCLRKRRCLTSSHSRWRW